ncbi:MAG: LysM peptidoglycan-binding domain-containing protein, partial [Treponema sp.]|nr:LysM peptidoglycan-binding domain-containing protein [Treponema sp.]
MFKRFRNNKKSFYKELVVPEGCRELTDEEMFRINGGSTEKKDGSQGSQDSKGESQSSSVTVQSGNTMSQIVSDYNKANGTNYTVNEIAEKNGISNPNVIHPGQQINFGSSPSGAGNMSAGSSASQANGNYGANGSHGSAGASTSNSSSGVSSSSTSGNGISSATSTGSVASAGTITSPKYDSPTYKEKVARYIAQAQGNRTRANDLTGKESVGTQPNGNNIVGQNTSTNSSNLTNNVYANNIKGCTDTSSSEDADLSESIYKNRNAEYNKNGNNYKCDNWVETVLEDDGIDPSKYLTAGDSSKTVAEHIAKLKTSGNEFTTTVPTEPGFYCTFMDGKGSLGVLDPHCGILEVKKNGKMIFHHNSSAATDYFKNGG